MSEWTLFNPLWGCHFLRRTVESDTERIAFMPDFDGLTKVNSGTKTSHGTAISCLLSPEMGIGVSFASFLMSSSMKILLYVGFH